MTKQLLLILISLFIYSACLQDTDNAGNYSEPTTLIGRWQYTLIPGNSSYNQRYNFHDSSSVTISTQFGEETSSSTHTYEILGDLSIIKINYKGFDLYYWWKLEGASLHLFIVETSEVAPSFRCQEGATNTDALTETWYTDSSCTNESHSASLIATLQGNTIVHPTNGYYEIHDSTGVVAGVCYTINNNKLYQFRAKVDCDAYTGECMNDDWHILTAY